MGEVIKIFLDYGILGAIVVAGGYLYIRKEKDFKEERKAWREEERKTYDMMAARHGVERDHWYGQAHDTYLVQERQFQKIVEVANKSSTAIEKTCSVVEKLNILVETMSRK